MAALSKMVVTGVAVKAVMAAGGNDHRNDAHASLGHEHGFGDDLATVMMDELVVSTVCVPVTITTDECNVVTHSPATTEVVETPVVTGAPTSEPVVIIPTTTEVEATTSSEIVDPTSTSDVVDGTTTPEPTSGGGLMVTGLVGGLFAAMAALLANTL